AIDTPSSRGVLPATTVMASSSTSGEASASPIARPSSMSAAGMPLPGSQSMMTRTVLLCIRWLFLAAGVGERGGELSLEDQQDQQGYGGGQDRAGEHLAEVDALLAGEV